MTSRRFFSLIAVLSLGLTAIATGCRHKTHASVMRPDKRDMIGTTGAGAETFKPLVEEAVCKLLDRHTAGVQPVGAPPTAPMRICFVGVENKSAEEIGDFKEQI